MMWTNVFVKYRTMCLNTKAILKCYKGFLIVTLNFRSFLIMNW